MHNFEHAIRSYFKGAHASDHMKKDLFFEALSAQQRNAISCQKIGRTYETMKKAFRRVYDMSKYDTFVEVMNIRMHEGETAFANCFQGLLPMTTKADHELAEFLFLSKLPNEVRMIAVVKLFENGTTFAT